MKKRLILLLLLCYNLLPALHAQQGIQDSIISKLQHYLSVLPQEKVYLHFDKPFYSIGDTIWFKAYLVNARGNRLSSLSKVIHVEVKSPQGKVKPLLLPAISGMAAAQLVLTDSLFKAGDYQVRAYTRWMRNAGEAFFFTHTIHVGDMLRYRTRVTAGFQPNNQGITAELHYTKADGNPLTAQSLTYQLKKGKKVLFEGKLSTDLNGKAGVSFAVTPTTEAPLVLETSATLNSGTILKNNFNVTTGQKPIALDFFPEGGELVEGIRSKVAFKALASNGKGVAVKGYIENREGEKVALFESRYAGMGTFSFAPQPENTYTAVLSEGEYNGLRFTLPKAQSRGVVLSVNPTADSLLLIQISRSESWKTISGLRLLVHCAGEVSHLIPLPADQKAVKFTIPLQQMKEGINQLTLFDADKRPLAERLVFIKKKDSAILLSDKAQYHTRDKVSISLSITNDNKEEIVGGYSASVVKSDNFDLPEEQQLSIYATLLLQADLKGNIETPNYYFSGYNPQKAAELDALLLTQGWRRFSWTEVFQQNPLPGYNAEKGLELSGRVTSPSGDKPVASAKINLLATKELLFLDTIANKQGYFSFKDIQLADSAQLLIRARGAKQNSNVKISLDEAGIPPWEETAAMPLSPVADTALKASMSRSAGLFEQMERTGKIIQGTTLKEVEIIGKKKAPEIKGSVYPFAAQPPDYTFEPDQLQEMVNLETHLKGLLGVSVREKEIWSPNRGKMLILLNGIPIKDLSGINPRSLTGVQIVRGSINSANMATALMFQGGTIEDGFGSPAAGIVFLTMNGIPDKFLKAERPLGLIQQPFIGYTYHREFYAPRYDTQKELPKNDIRPTLFWKPDIITDEDGKARFDFYTADEPGRYKVTLEGVGANGQLTRKITYFQVKEN